MTRATLHEPARPLLSTPVSHSLSIYSSWFLPFLLAALQTRRRQSISRGRENGNSCETFTCPSGQRRTLSGPTSPEGGLMPTCLPASQKAQITSLKLCCAAALCDLTSSQNLCLSATKKVSVTIRARIWCLSAPGDLDVSFKVLLCFVSLKTCLPETWLMGWFS